MKAAVHRWEELQQDRPLEGVDRRRILGRHASLAEVTLRRGTRIRWLTPAALVMIPVAVATLQVLYPITLLRAMFVRRVEWRGVRYHVGGPWKIRLEQYVPYQIRARDDSVRSL